MWKIISLSALLIVAQATNIEDFYGDWLEAAFYPVATYVPICIRFGFSKTADNVQCTYADGTNVPSVQVSMMTETARLHDHPTMPMTIVDTPAEVMPALNLTVKCGDKDMRDRAVIRLVNKDYFILYSNIPESMAYTRTDIEQNSAILFGRNVVSSEDLTKVMLSIEDLKNRRGAQMCVTENYQGFKAIENYKGD